MEGEESSFYSVLQASRILGVTPEKVHELIDQGKLEAPYEGAGLRLIRARSIHARPKGASPGAQASTASASESMATPTSVPEEDREKNRGFDFDLLVLVIIGTMTLLAAAYTLLPALLWGGSPQPKETAGAANDVPQPDKFIAGTAADPEETTPATSSAPAGCG